MLHSVLLYLKVYQPWSYVGVIGGTIAVIWLVSYVLLTLDDNKQLREHRQKYQTARRMRPNRGGADMTG